MSRIVEEMVVTPDVVDPARLRSAIRRAREFGVVLPTFSELAKPPSHNLDRIDPDEPRSENLWRVNWYNGPDRRKRLDVPGHIVLPGSAHGRESADRRSARLPLPDDRRAQSVARLCRSGAAACDRPFRSGEHKAIWPSTGNYCRGGVAISRILGCRGVAVLPAGMSRERFDWLEKWVTDPSDIIRTPGTESNVKEIYDKCAELERDRRT